MDKELARKLDRLISLQEQMLKELRRPREEQKRQKVKDLTRLAGRDNGRPKDKFAGV